MLSGRANAILSNQIDFGINLMFMLGWTNERTSRAACVPSIVSYFSLALLFILCRMHFDTVSSLKMNVWHLNMSNLKRYTPHHQTTQKYRITGYQSKCCIAENFHKKVERQEGCREEGGGGGGRGEAGKIYWIQWILNIFQCTSLSLENGSWIWLQLNTSSPHFIWYAEYVYQC